MKRVFVIVLAVLMLGLSVPKQSEANGAWLPAVIIGSFFLSAIHAAAHASPVYPYYAPGQAYVNPPPVNQDYYRYGPGQADAYGPSAQAYVNPPPQYGWRQNGWGRPPVPPQNGWGQNGWGRPPVPPQNGWGQNGWGRPPVASQNGWGLSQR